MNLTADVVKAKILQDVKFGKEFTASDLAFYRNPNQQQKSAGKLAVKCFRCKKQGYYTSLCQKKPSEKKTNEIGHRGGKVLLFSILPKLFF